MNTLLRWDPISRTQWNPFKDREEWESRVVPAALRAASVARRGMPHAPVMAGISSASDR